MPAHWETSSQGWETARRAPRSCAKGVTFPRLLAQLEHQRVGNPHPHARNKGEERWRDIPFSAPTYPSASQTRKLSSIASWVPETPAALWAAAKISSVPLTSQEAKICSMLSVRSRAGRGWVAYPHEPPAQRALTTTCRSRVQVCWVQAVTPC